jgi:hypothetical protein
MSPVSDRAAILATVDEVYAGPAWHGPSVLEALEGVDAATAARKLANNRNSIWELVLHLTHGRHVLIERVRHTRIDAFPRPLREEWWPQLPAELTEQAWRDDVALLAAYHAKFRDAIIGASPEQLERVPANSQHSIAQQLTGTAIHDAYHAGQIRLLALHFGRDERTS